MWLCYIFSYAKSERCAEAPIPTLPLDSSPSRTHKKRNPCTNKNELPCVAIKTQWERYTTRTIHRFEKWFAQHERMNTGLNFDIDFHVVLPLLFSR